jgi:hypothetical protein
MEFHFTESSTHKYPKTDTVVIIVFQAHLWSFQNTVTGLDLN